MRANFIFSNLNPCGGGERFTLVTMKAAHEMGLEIDLTTLEQPDLPKLENAFGKDLASVMKKIRKINLLDMFSEQNICRNLHQNNYDLIINTHGDIDPYYDSSLNAKNMIVYCHYPSAKSFLENEDKDYLKYHLKIDRLHPHSDSKVEASSQISYRHLNQMASQIVEPVREGHTANNSTDTINDYVKWVKKTYDSMIKNSFLITNSKYSKMAILQEYDREDAIVLSPPVDVDTIISKVRSNQGIDPLNYSDENCILVICRIEPSKRIENVVYLAKLLKDKDINTRINIVGSSEPFYQKYYRNLLELISEYHVSDNVKFHVDASYSELIELMKKSKMFFHPREGEHFGMSIVEAMSAGLIPVVPAIGGQSEFVPPEYQYRSLEEAFQKISSIINMPKEQITKESYRMNNIAMKFSESNYKRQFQSIINRLLCNQV